MHNVPRVRSRAFNLVSLLSLGIALFATGAHAQGITATAKTASVSETPGVAAMKRRVDDLERRVLELEKEKADQVEPDASEVTAYKKLEQRLAAVEAAVREEKARDKSAQHTESSKTLGPQTVRATFVVVDDEDIVLVTIERSETSQAARLTVGDTKGASVGIAATGDSAFVQLIDQAQKPKIGIEVTPNHQGIEAEGPNGSTWFGSGNEKIALVQVKNEAGYAVAEMRGMPQSQGGQMTIANANGNELMYVGESEKGVGILRMGPCGYGVASSMQNQGLPASALIGKKD